MPRIFVAIPLPREVADELDRALPPLPALRRVAPELMHVTLAFVGQVGEEQVEPVISAVRTAARTSGAFRVAFSAVGRFPEHGRPHVVWADTGRAGDAIVALGAAVRAELARRGVPFDPKPLRAHVTLARVRDEVSDEDARAIVAAVSAARFERELVFRVSGAHVMESRLSSTGPPGRITGLPGRIKGPLYSSRAEVPLTGLPGRITGPPR